MTVGKEILKCQTEWLLGSSKIINSEHFKILGTGSSRIQRIIIVTVILQIE